MTTITNSFGELQTSWTSHKHPDNPNFMQVVKYMHIQSKDGRNNLYWSLANASANDNHVIANITLVEAQSLYVDAESVELIEADYQEWLSKQSDPQEDRDNDVEYNNEKESNFINVWK